MNHGDLLTIVICIPRSTTFKAVMPLPTIKIESLVFMITLFRKFLGTGRGRCCEAEKTGSKVEN
jgi:hypothetical protein